MWSSPNSRRNWKNALYKYEKEIRVCPTLIKSRGSGCFNHRRSVQQTAAQCVRDFHHVLHFWCTFTSLRNLFLVVLKIVQVSELTYMCERVSATVTNREKPYASASKMHTQLFDVATAIQFSRIRSELVKLCLQIGLTSIDLKQNGCMSMTHRQYFFIKFLRFDWTKIHFLHGLVWNYWHFSQKSDWQTFSSTDHDHEIGRF